MITKRVSKTVITWSLLAFSLLAISGCVSPFFIPASNATSEPIETVIVKTADAAFTQTARAISPTATFSQTPPPTKTSTVTPTPTATVIFSTWTPIAPPTEPVIMTGDDYACTIASSSPGGSIAPRTDFDAKWVVYNTGKKSWDRNNTDYYYSSGARMHKKAAYDLPKNVDPGEKVSLVVDMIAPKNTGEYRVVWRLRVGKTQFCNMELNVTVK